MKNKYNTPTDRIHKIPTAKGGKDVKKLGLTVTGYIVRDGERIRRTDLPPEEQKRLAIAWTAKAMSEVGYEPMPMCQGVI